MGAARVLTNGTHVLWAYENHCPQLKWEFPKISGSNLDALLIRTPTTGHQDVERAI